MTESRARKVADIPTDVFEAYLADTPKPTRNGLLRAGGCTPRPRKKKTALIENPVEKFRNRVREIRAHGGDRPRWSMADLDLADAVLRNPPKRKKAEAGKHLHDLYARRRKAGDELDGGLWQARIDIIKMVGHLESVDFVTNGLRDADQDTVADVYQYLRLSRLLARPLARSGVRAHGRTAQAERKSANFARARRGARPKKSLPLDASPTIKDAGLVRRLAASDQPDRKPNLAVRDDRLAVQISEMSNRELVEKVRGHIRALAAPGSQVKSPRRAGAGLLRRA